ncbi:MAG: type II toxin-antitoxin system YafQ family toxin [Deltaproteobacteria bacterium]|nr:type II toxin-antitoxin system YafQ family toxin [Deltaproteobacteria bacterium]
MKKVVHPLVQRKPIPDSDKDHPLKGNWLGYREIHIQFDWILIYKIENDTLYLIRTGRHHDIFKLPRRQDNDTSYSRTRFGRKFAILDG